MRAGPKHRPIAALCEVDQGHEDVEEAVPPAQPREAEMRVARVGVEALRPCAGAAHDGAKLVDSRAKREERRGRLEQGARPQRRVLGQHPIVPISGQRVERLHHRSRGTHRLMHQLRPRRPLCRPERTPAAVPLVNFRKGVVALDWVQPKLAQPVVVARELRRDGSSSVGHKLSAQAGVRDDGEAGVPQLGGMLEQPAGRRPRSAASDRERCRVGAEAQQHISSWSRRSLVMQ
mmetsp:Transcript_44313/g.139625  ORF Transcript_44313/g.139625 Transcript_44313/m.139625 type:complete len:233 (-) Transcript_44313:8-706(-)